MKNKAARSCTRLALGFALPGLLLMANIKPASAQNGQWQNGATTYSPDGAGSVSPTDSGDNGYECAAGVNYDPSTNSVSGVYDQGFDITWEIQYVTTSSPYPSTGFTISASATADGAVGPYKTTAATDSATANVGQYTSAKETNAGDDNEPYGPHFVPASPPQSGSADMSFDGRIHADANAGPDYTGDPGHENSPKGSSAEASASAGLTIGNSTSNPSPPGPPSA